MATQILFFPPPMIKMTHTFELRYPRIQLEMTPGKISWPALKVWRLLPSGDPLWRLRDPFWRLTMQASVFEKRRLRLVDARKINITSGYQAESTRQTGWRKSISLPPTPFSALPHNVHFQTKYNGILTVFNLCIFPKKEKPSRYQFG